jgi:hypothetical protein
MRHFLVVIWNTLFLITSGFCQSIDEPRHEKRPGYKVGISAMLFQPEQTTFTGHFFFIQFSKSIGTSYFIDMSLGFSEDFGIGETSREDVRGDVGDIFSGRARPLYLWHEFHISSTSRSYMLSASFNRWLVQFEKFGVSAFAGVSLTRSYFSHNWAVARAEGARLFTPNGESDGTKYFVGFPVGLSLHLYQKWFVSLKIDFGYMYSPSKFDMSYPEFSLDELRREYPQGIFVQPAELEISPSGMIMGLGLRMHF